MYIYSNYHLLVEFHGWGERFAIAAQDVAEVDVDEVPALGEEEIVIVPVPHS